MSIALALVCSWAVWAVIIIGHPDTTDNPRRADAIIVLGPSNKRIGQARDIATSLGIYDVALSIGDFPGQQHTCTQPRLTVTCFVPNPYNTAGEAAQIGALAAENGWGRIIVIASQAQAARASWLIGRCFDGNVQMVAATNAESQHSWVGWAKQLVYQSAAWAKDAVSASCAVPDGDTPSDRGTQPDANTQPDGGTPRDQSTPPDRGTQPDANTQPDGRTPRDQSTPSDASTPPERPSPTPGRAPA